MSIKLDWLGCATFRLLIDDQTIFLDTYIDRVSAAPNVGISTTEIKNADFIFIGHSHFDHIGGADIIAKNTGAEVIGSNESVRILIEAGVPREQLRRAQGVKGTALAILSPSEFIQACIPVYGSRTHSDLEPMKAKQDI